MPGVAVHGPIGVALLELPDEPTGGAAMPCWTASIEEAPGLCSLGLLGDGDLTMATDVTELATTAALFVDEHTWATPFVAATLDVGGLLVASRRVSVQDIMDARDVLVDLS